MIHKLLLTSLLLLLSNTSFANVNFFEGNKPYVVALTGAYTDDQRYQYGISAFDTKGKGKWGLYGEMLFAYEDSQYVVCDPDCTNVSLEDSDFSFTAGATYGFTERFYGLMGVGLRYNKLQTEPLYNSSACDSDDDDDEEVSPVDDQYCEEDSRTRIAGQLGLLYVTPFGLSLASTVDTEKTLSLSIGYQF